MSHDASPDLEQLRTRICQLELENDRAHQQTAEARSLSHCLLESCLEGILVHQDNRIRYANPALAALFRYNSPQQLLGLPVWDALIDPQDWPTLQARVARILQGDTLPLSPLFHGKRRDGSSVPLQARGSLISWEGQPAVLATYLDLSERLHATQALQESEVRLRTIVEEMPLLIDAFDFQGRVVLWNKECARVTGYEAQEVMGRADTLGLLYPDPAYRDRMIAHWIERGADYRDQEWTLTRKDGALRTIAWSNIALHVPIPGWASWAVGVDVTQRRKAQEALRAGEERLLSLLQMMPHGIAEIDVEGHFLFTNLAHDRMYGYEPGTMIGHSIHETYVGPQTHAELAARLVRLVRDQPPPDFYPCQGRKRDGSIIDLEATWDYRRDETGQVIGFVAVVTDVTARKRAEEERRRIEERLRETQKLESLGVLAGGIAHDFNNLLMSILGNAELARHQLEKGARSAERGAPSAQEAAARAPRSALSALAEIEKASLRAAELCQQMLAYAGRGQFKVAATDLGALVQETADLLRLTISKKVSLRLDLKPRLPLVQADASQLRQVVLNLLMNAAEAIGDCLGRIMVRLTLETLQREALAGTMFGDGLPAGHYLCLEVKDTGGGMSEEVRARIFEPFFTTRATGRGLGLSAVAGIVRGHQGTMALETLPSQGTTFRLFLPASSSAEAETAREGERATGKEERERGMVLVADDEPGMRQVTRALLELLGFSVMTAADGQEAVELFQREQQRFRFVMLDITMPRLDGRQTLQELHALQPDLPAILMSGYSEREVVKGAGLKGRIEFLQKPFRREELTARVRTLLAEAEKK